MLNNNFIQEFLNLKINKKQFDFFDIIPPKEVLVSKWIEFILNPNINGLGNYPLQSLIQLAGYNYNLNDYEFEISDTETSTDNLKNRYIPKI